MKFVLMAAVILTAFVSHLVFKHHSQQISGAPPYQVDDNPPVAPNMGDLYQGWVRPDGPPKVALQVGHWKNEEIPDELYRLRGNTGSSGGGKSEWEVNYEIARLTKALLEKKGVTVELLPATIPPDYWADVFVAIHADGSESSTTSGFKGVTPRRDMTGNASELLSFVENAYQKTTKLSQDPNVSRNMRGYYAFGWWRYDHAVHPMTTSIILETGFLTNPHDRTIIVNKPELSAKGLSDGILAYITSERLL